MIEPRHGMPRPAGPSLDDVATDPRTAASLPLPVVLEFLSRLHVAEGALLTRLLTLTTAPPAPRGDENEILTVDKAAQALGMSKDFLYRNWKTLRLGYKDADRGIKFPRRTLEKYVARRTP